VDLSILDKITEESDRAFPPKREYIKIEDNSECVTSKELSIFEN